MHGWHHNKYQHPHGYRFENAGRCFFRGTGHESVYCVQHFVRQSLREARIPFDVSLNYSNKETIAAMLEAERIAKDPSVKGYTDLGF